MKWKRVNYLKKYYDDYVILFLEKGTIVSYDEVFSFFKTKEELEEKKIAYILVNNMCIIKKSYFQENNFYLYQDLFCIVICLRNEVS